MAFTNYIQQIKGTNNTTYDLVDSSASHFVKGTQTAATNVWTGALPDGVTAYYDGLTIDYFLPYAGTATAATLNLGGKGAKPVYAGNSTGAVTTQFPQYSVLHLTYLVNSSLNSGNGCWKVTGYYNSNNYVNQTHSTSNTNYDMALSSYTSNSSGADITYHSTKIKGNPSTGRITTEDLSDSAVTTFVNSLSYSQINAVDYVVEEGTSGNWKYRKWNSGIGECWLQYNPGSYTCGTARGSLYSGANLTLTFPITFTSTPTTTGNVSLGTDAYVVWLQFNGLGTTTAQCRMVSSGSVAANSNYLISVYVIGRWK